MTLFSTLLHVGMKGPICMTDSVKVGLLETLLIREVAPTLGDFPCCHPDIKCLYRLCCITLPWHLTLIASKAHGAFPSDVVPQNCKCIPRSPQSNSA